MGEEEMIEVFGYLIASFGFSLLISVVWAIACGVVAKKRGRNAIGWAILGLIFGLIALIILLCMQPIAINKPANNQNASFDSWTCSRCGAKIDGKALFCPSCGSARNQNQIGEQAREQSAVTENTKSDVQDWVCPNCGNKNSSKTTYCTKCYSNKPNN